MLIFRILGKARYYKMSTKNQTIERKLQNTWMTLVAISLSTIITGVATQKSLIVLAGAIFFLLSLVWVLCSAIKHIGEIAIPFTNNITKSSLISKEKHL